MRIHQLLETAFAPMDRRTGMFPANSRCTDCNIVLNADGNHRAELYAGTFTGLCYACERKQPYVCAEYPLDGAIRVSHPPSCPSHRRDRQTFTAYRDCDACKGLGCTARWAPYGGQYYEYCRPCLDRFSSHPLRKKTDRRREQIYDAEMRVWQRNLERIAREQLPKRPGKKILRARMIALSVDPKTSAIKREIICRGERARRRLSTEIVVDVRLHLSPQTKAAA